MNKRDEVDRYEKFSKGYDFLLDNFTKNNPTYINLKDWIYAPSCAECELFDTKKCFHGMHSRGSVNSCCFPCKHFTLSEDKISFLKDYQNKFGKIAQNPHNPFHLSELD